MRGSFRRTDAIPQHGSTGRHVPRWPDVKPRYPMLDAIFSFQAGIIDIPLCFTMRGLKMEGHGP